MGADVSAEGRRAGRFTVVRIASRSADVSTFGGLLWLWGSEWFALAYLISSSLNWLIDFWGQKLWTFKNDDARWRDLLRECAWYVALRSLNLGFALLLWWLLQNLLGFKWWVAAAVAVPVAMVTWFLLSRWIFFGPASRMR